MSFKFPTTVLFGTGLPRRPLCFFHGTYPELNDLTNISFDEFVSLIFERAISPEAEEVYRSLEYVEGELGAKKICAHYVRLFREPEFLLSRFTKQQLEAGFWAIMGHAHEWSAGDSDILFER